MRQPVQLLCPFPKKRETNSKGTVNKMWWVEAAVNIKQADVGDKTERPLNGDPRKQPSSRALRKEVFTL